MRRLLLGSLLVIASVSMFACASDDADEGSGGDAAATSTATAAAEVTATEAAGGEEVATEIARFTFETPIEISVGTSITWTNTEEPHTVTARDGSFDSDRIPQGESFTHTFEAAGTFDYFCQIHPAMEGTVVVE